MERRARVHVLVAIASLAFSYSELAVAQSAGVKEAKELIALKSSIGAQLALAAKSLADEQFIDGDRKAARGNYSLASGAVLQAQANPEQLSVESQQTLELLMRDIEFRTTLVDAGLPFWGLEFTSSADIPVLRLKALQEGTVKLKSLNEEIQKLDESLKKVQLAQLKQMSEQFRQETQSDIYQLEQVKGEVQTESQAKARSDAYGRISRLQTLQDELVAKQREADKGIRSLEKQNQQLVLDGLSEAAGIPASVTAAAASGNINEALNQAALSYAGSPEFSELLNKAQGVAPGLSKLYEQAATLADQAKQDVDLARKIAATVRDPSLDNLAAIGGKIVERMPASQRAALEKVVLDAKPVGVLLSAAKKEKAILDGLGRQLSGEGDAAISEVIGVLAKEHSDLRKWYGDALGQLAQVANPPIAFSEEAVDQLLRSWAKEFVGTLAPQAATALRVHLQVADLDALAEVLASKGIAAIPSFTLAAGKLDIPSLSISIDLAGQLKSMSTAGLPDLDAAGLEARFKKLIATGQENVMGTLLTGVTQYGLESVTTVFARNRSSGEVFDAVMAKLEPQAKVAAAGAMAELEAGTLVARARTAEVGAIDASKRESVAAPKPDAAQLETMKKLVAGPLAAAFPAAAAGVKVAEFIGNNLEMGRLSDKIQKASEQIDRYVEEEMHIRRLIEQAQTQEELAKLDTDIAKLHRKQVSSDLKGLKAASDALLETEDELRKKIVGYRLNHFFFVAEELRAQYAQLNRSLALWSGAAPGPRDYLQQKLRDDPRRLRLAVDPYVRAFDVFEKDQARQREDIDRLTGYWDYLSTQISYFCLNLKTGCSTTTPSIGPIRQTEAISLRNALAGEWAHFEEWKRDRSQEPFTFALLLRPGQNDIELNFDKLGARVVHVMLTRVGPGGMADERASTITVTHPGFAFVPTMAGFVSEQLAPVQRSGLDPISEMKDNQTYGNRWGSASFTPREFEGQGFFTVWLVRIDPASVNYDVTDLKMRFVYQHAEPSALPIALAGLDAKAIEILRAETGEQARISFDGLRMLGDRKAVEQFVEAWRKGQGTASKVKWAHGSMGNKPSAPPVYDLALVKAAAALVGAN